MTSEWCEDFLVDREPLGWRSQEGGPKSLAPHSVFLGRGANALEVALASAAGQPKAEDVRKLWTARQNKRPSPLLLIIGYPVEGVTKVTVCGPAGEHPTLLNGLDVSQVERLADAALSEPTRHAAIRFLVAMLPEADSDLPGVRNSGLLAGQELRHGVPRRPDWDAACAVGKSLLALSGRTLVERLGFKIDGLSVRSSVLTLPGGTKRAVAVFLEDGETFETPSEGFNGTTALSHALNVADNENLPWVVLTRGREIRLYAARADTGVGRKGRSETFVEANLALLPDDRAGYLPLLFGAGALSDDGTIEDILRRSEDFAAGLADRLRQRVYFEAVPRLAEAIASRMGDPWDLTDKDLEAAYEQTLVVLFRLLFVAYGEDRDLLPYQSNSKYADHSLKRIARHLSEDRRSGSVTFDAAAEDLWEDVNQLWRAVDKGNQAWGLPAYNGGLFSADATVNRSGAALAGIRLTDVEFGPALASLLVDEGADGVIGPVDFRSLSVREFGTIYEGLLESMLSVAQTDLVTDKKGSYIPARADQEVLYAQGEVYFHNRSGSRKATGSYFTKPFAVEHLLDHALEPALDAHVARLRGILESGDDAGAAEVFFDFRCVDLAMGSGHFLVAAVDRIEARLANFLAENPIPAVSRELAFLRESARDHLGDLADGYELETTSLLRRLVARRCVYGVDRNHIAVELARLAIWIHTFVPGLPLSFLDHSLRQGDSLTGIGTLDEALDMLDPQASKTGAVSLFRQPIEEFLGRASTALRRLATITERSAADIREARQAHRDALSSIEPARQLFDLLVAARLGRAAVPVTVSEESVAADPALAAASTLTAELGSLHFPIAFPEVFLRDDPGFDCILGNPPWEEATVEELGFFALRQPGLRSMAQADQKKAVKALRDARPDLVTEYEDALVEAEQTRRLLLAGPYPGMGRGDPDLYKAFTWRFWHLVRPGGAIGVVLPRSALMASGSAPWRIEILDHGSFSDVTMMTNTGGWVFDDAEFRYTIGLVSIRRGEDHVGRLTMRGPYPSFAAYQRGLPAEPAEFSAADFRDWSEGASFPLIPNDVAAKVFQKIRSHPRVDTAGDWVCRPTTELHATSDKPHMQLDPAVTDGLWPVYKGASFDLWEPDRGEDTYYAWADPDHIVPVLQDKRARSARRAKSAYAGFDAATLIDPDTLPCWSPRIVFRDITRATDTRTVRAALAYPEVILANQAPYLLWPKGDERDQAYLLGVLCSMPLDWYARRVIETHVNFHLFNAFPIPRPDRNDPVRRRVEVITGRLSAVDDWFEGWADAVGVEVGTVDDAEKPDLLAELDACVGHLYGLTGSDLTTIYDTFHEGADHSVHAKAVLTYHRSLR